MPPEPVLETDQILEGTAATEICRWAGCREWAEKTPGMQISVEKLVPASQALGLTQRFIWNK